VLRLRRRPLPGAGHYWTIAPWLRHQLRPETPPPSRPWETHAVDGTRYGAVRITGRLHPTPAADAVLVVVHGLGGHIDAHYMVSAARAAARVEMAALAMNLRGAPRDGEDFYHAGLTADVEAALASRELASYRRAYLLGYSLGGHIALRWALRPTDPRVRAVAAVCPPIDLAAGAAAIDEPGRAFYRRYVLRNLLEMYEAFAERRPRDALLPVGEARRITSLVDWDDRVVAPHHGFAGAEDYYDRASVGPRLEGLHVPALVVSSEADPMVAPHTTKPLLEAAGDVDDRWTPLGGHVGFPRDLDLGEDAPSGLEHQIVAWLRRA